MCVCVYLWSRLLKNILALNNVSHHSVFKLLILLSSELDGLQIRTTTSTHTPKHIRKYTVNDTQVYKMQNFAYRWKQKLLLNSIT